MNQSEYMLAQRKFFFFVKWLYKCKISNLILIFSFHFEDVADKYYNFLLN